MFGDVACVCWLISILWALQLNDTLASLLLFLIYSLGGTLCLGKSKTEVNTLKSSFRVGLNSDMQWSVFNFPLNELREYDTFKPTPYFMKTYVPFFTQYAQVRRRHTAELFFLFCCICVGV